MSGNRIQRWQGLRQLAAVLAALSALSVSTSRSTAAASAGGTRVGPGKSAIHVQVVDDARAPRDSLVHATREADRIWAPAGLRLVWTIADSRGDEPDAHLASHGSDLDRAIIDIYVIVRADLAPVRSQVAEISRRPGTAVMGRVLFDGTPERPKLVEISLASTMASIARAPHVNRHMKELPAGLRHEVLGSALGRVIAHEIGHCLFGQGHTREGLMKPVLMPRELISKTPPTLPAKWLAPSR